MIAFWSVGHCLQPIQSTMPEFHENDILIILSFLKERCRPRYNWPFRGMNRQTTLVTNSCFLSFCFSPFLLALSKQIPPPGGSLGVGGGRIAPDPAPICAGTRL